MNPSRAELLQRLDDRSGPWDIIVIGGGASGLGAAVDAASRGFSCGTSSRSTKLIHGGVRYLRQGNLALVRESLRERSILLSNAAHLVHDVPFVIPLYRWWERAFYGIGMSLYDLMSGTGGLEHSRHLSREETMALVPTVRRRGLRGGIVYHDGQFDDSRLAICLARTLSDLGGTPLNYMKVSGFARSQGRLTSITAIEGESGREYRLPCRGVINATGVYCDQLRRMDEPSCSPLITLSQGAHLVIIGTTDTPMDTVMPEPVPLPDEIDFLLAHAGRCLERRPTRSDILSIFAGLRPLTAGKRGQKTAQLSRKHQLTVAASGLVTVTGGKWTTYRSMAAAAVDAAAVQGGLDSRPSITHSLRLHGWEPPSLPAGPMDGYGSDRRLLEMLADGNPAWRERLHARLPYTSGEIVWAVRFEWARSVEDVLARRTRALFLDAGACREIAPRVASLMATELGRDQTWQSRQLDLFDAVAAKYLPT